MAQVLVANADADLQEVLVELLTEAGHQVLGVADSKVVWHLLHMASSSRVAVLDMDLPRLDGLHALQQVLTDPEVATRHGLIVLTAVPLRRLRLFAPDLLFDLPESVIVLNKPFDLEDLEQAVEKVSQRRWYTRVPGLLYQGGGIATTCSSVVRSRLHGQTETRA